MNQISQGIRCTNQHYVSKKIFSLDDLSQILGFDLVVSRDLLRTRNQKSYQNNKTMNNANRLQINHSCHML